MAKENALSHKQHEKGIFVTWGKQYSLVQQKYQQDFFFFPPEYTSGCEKEYCIVKLGCYKKIVPRTAFIAFIYSPVQKAEILIFVSN